MKNLNYIGLDVHKNSIMMAESKEAGKANIVGEYPKTDPGVKKLIKKLKTLSEDYEVRICSEAGPCGYVLKRILDKHSFVCEIAAPSLIPVQTGNKIKNDKRDAKKLARYYRAGELTFISVLDEDKEALRDLIRCRDDIMIDLKRAKQRLNHFLIRHGFHYQGSNWTEGHQRWMSQLKFDNAYLIQTFYYYSNELEFLKMQLKDMDREIELIAETEEYRDKIKALCAFRGIGVLTAMIILSEVVDFSRFSNPR